jgi:hypothetical protein
MFEHMFHMEIIYYLLVHTYIYMKLTKKLPSAASWWLGSVGSNARFLPFFLGMESRCLLPRNLQRSFDSVLLLVS